MVIAYIANLYSTRPSYCKTMNCTYGIPLKVAKKMAGTSKQKQHTVATNIFCVAQAQIMAPVHVT